MDVLNILSPFLAGALILNALGFWVYKQLIIN
jgi:hypothetical protein